jgi:hypothetical protein
MHSPAVMAGGQVKHHIPWAHEKGGLVLSFPFPKAENLTFLKEEP